MIKFKFLPALFLSLFVIQTLYPQTTYYVTERSDSGPGSLRNVLSQASGGTTIRFVLSVDTVFLTSGELLIDKSLNIIGNPPYTCIIKQDTLAQFRIIRVQSTDSLHVEFDRLAIVGGHAYDGNSADIQGQHGGGIFIPDDFHELFISNCFINGNHAGDGYKQYVDPVTGNGGSGGGVYSFSKLQFTSCTVSNNSAGKGANASSGGDWDYQHAGSGGSGGAIFCQNHLSIQNCILSNNHAGAGGDAFGGTYSSGGNGGSGGGGGAVRCKYGNVSITNSQAVNNSSGKGGNANNSQTSCSAGAAGNGGAILLSDCSVIISSSEIKENYSGNGGGASGNEAGYGKNGGNGGGIFTTNSNLSLDSVDIMLNHTGSGGSSGGWTMGEKPGSGGHGGGIYSEHGLVKLNECQLTGNYTGKGANVTFYIVSGGHGGSGGGVYLVDTYSGSWLRNCRIENNHCGNGGTFKDISYDTNPPVVNGGSGGGVSVSNAFIDIINCAVSDNKGGNAVFKTTIPPGGDYSLPKGGSGGGIYLNQSNHRIINSTIANNYAGTAVVVNAAGKETVMISDSVRGQGGGVFTLADSAEIINSILAFNYLGVDTVPNNIEGIAEVNYCLLSTDTLCTLIGNDNFLNTDPHFLSFPDDLSLTAASFAVNTGAPDTSGLFLPPADLSANPRIYGERIDMGAYEFQGEPQAQYSFSTYEIEMDSVAVGGFVVDSLGVFNTGLHPIIINNIITHPPFSLSLDKSNWAFQLEEVAIPGGEPNTSLEIYVKFEGLNSGNNSDSIAITIEDSVTVVDIKGYCKLPYLISAEEIVMDTIVMGGFAVDSLCIWNNSLAVLTINKIQTFSPFYISLDKTTWDNQIDEAGIPSIESLSSLIVYAKFESPVLGFFSNNIIITISDNSSFVQISGYCKSTEGIYEEDHNDMISIVPNPYSQETRISFILEKNNDVILEIFDSRGIRKDQQRLKDLASGKNTINCKRKNLPAGIYFYKLSFGNKTAAGKFVIVDR